MKRNYLLECEIEEFREIQKDYFDDDGKQLTAVQVGGYLTERMLDLIDKLEAEYLKEVK